jgi:hypothetical protein
MARQLSTATFAKLPPSRVHCNQSSTDLEARMDGLALIITTAIKMVGSIVIAVINRRRRPEMTAAQPTPDDKEP